MVSTGGSGSLGVEESRALLQKTVERDRGIRSPDDKHRLMQPRGPRGLRPLDEWVPIGVGYVGLLVLMTAGAPWRWWGLGVGIAGMGAGIGLGALRTHRRKVDPDAPPKKVIRGWRQIISLNAILVAATLAVAVVTGKAWVILPGSASLVINSWYAYRDRDEDFSAHRQNG